MAKTRSPLTKIILTLLVACLLLSAVSCALGSDGTPEYPKFDYLSMNLSKYVTLGQYKGLEFTITPKPSVTEAEVADKIRSDLIYNGHTVKVTDRAVTKNDTVSISYVGLLDGVAFEGRKD